MIGVIASLRISQDLTMGRLGMLIAQVDDAEPVAFGIFQDNEVRILRIAVPVHPPGAERHEPGRFGLLFAGIGDMQVKMQARMTLRRGRPSTSGTPRVAERWRATWAATARLAWRRSCWSAQ